MTNELTPSSPTTAIAGAADFYLPNGPQPGHKLNPVADDWAAIEVWLSSADEDGESRSVETLKTYRFHLAKLY